MKRNTYDIDDLVKEIADHSYNKHIIEKKEHTEKYHGIELNINTQEDFQRHIRESLEDEQTKCFQVKDGFEKGTMYFYNAKTNTYICVPEQESLKPTSYRPLDFENRFQKKIDKTVKHQGYEPEIKRSIYELLPELKREREREAAQREAQRKAEVKERQKQRLYKMMIEDNERQRRDRGNDYENEYEP